MVDMATRMQDIKLQLQRLRSMQAIMLRVIPRMLCLGRVLVALGEERRLPAINLLLESNTVQQYQVRTSETFCFPSECSTLQWGRTLQYEKPSFWKQLL
jgi:hypothetical protein